MDCRGPGRDAEPFRVPTGVSEGVCAAHSKKET